MWMAQLQLRALAGHTTKNIHHVMHELCQICQHFLTPCTPGHWKLPGRRRGSPGPGLGATATVELPGTRLGKVQRREGPDESMTAFRTSLRDADAIQPSGSSSRCSAFGAPEHSARRWCFLQCRDAQLGRGRCPLCHHCRLEREGGGDPRL